MARDVGREDFDTAVIERSFERPVVVDFWASWCAPCRTLGPVLERVASEHGDAVDLVKVDVDANPELAAALGVQGIPAVKAIREGRVVNEFVGAYPESAVRQFFDSILPSEADRLAEAGDAAEDETEAEEAYRKALEQIADHRGAVLGLAGILGERGQHDEARALLARLPDDPDVRRLRAHIDLTEAAQESKPDDPLAAATATGDWRPVLERLLDEVRAGDRDGARDRMVDIFEILGPEDPLVQEYRAKLASALF
jgi:putative thioredoxin